MRLTIQAFGLELDVTFGLAGSDDDAASALNGGTLASTPVAGPGHIPWEDAGMVHQFEAPEDKRVGFR